MPDPNARRDQALADIARQLKEINQHLSQLVKLNTPKTMLIRPDPFNQPQEPQPGDVVISTGPEPDKPPGPTFPKSDNPYFKQRSPQVEHRGDSNTQGGLGFEGPYGDGNGTPYS